MRGLGGQAGRWGGLAAERPYLATCAGAFLLGTATAAWTVLTSSAHVVELGSGWLVVAWILQAAVMGAFVVIVLRRPSDQVAQVLVTLAVVLFVAVLAGGIAVEPDRFGALSSRMMLVVVAGGAMVRSWTLQAATVVASTMLWLPLFLAEVPPPRPLTDWPLSWALAVTLSGFLVFVSTGERRQTLEVTGRLRRAALLDALTGVHNRAGLLVRGRDIVAAAAATRGRISCFFIDVDGMKEVNDSHGHAAGDHLLRMVAQALSTVTRDVDVVGRWGGDEFLVVSPGRWRDPADLAARVQEALDHDPRPPAWWRRGIDVVSVGGATRLVVPADDPAAVLDALIAEADSAMYRLRSARRA